ncbi:MAG: hypothetical protein ABIQ47_13260 [Tepidiformaceae bacterium]
MATFIVLDASKAPKAPPKRSPLAARMAEYERYAVGVKGGQVGKLVPTGGESTRSVAVRISRAGNRIGRSVDAWVADGAVYFKASQG